MTLGDDGFNYGGLEGPCCHVSTLLACMMAEASHESSLALKLMVKGLWGRPDIAGCLRNASCSRCKSGQGGGMHTWHEGAGRQSI